MNETFPAIVELALACAFATGCRWIKRNPSSFLRYALFPFGGIQVERWPRILLWIVRAGAILGFFFFVLNFLDMLLPIRPGATSPALLYGRYGAAMVISFLALRGTTEPGSEREPSSKRPHPLAPASPISRASDSAVPSGPTGPRLSDAQAPPVPGRANLLSAPPEEVVRGRVAYALSFIVFGLSMATFCFALGGTGIAFFFLAVGLLGAGLRLYLKNAPVAICPFCEGVIERYSNSRQPEPFRCPHCGEYSQLTLWLVGPMNPEAVAETPFFLSPAFENAVWPNGCALCGAPPTHFDEAGDVGFQYRRLAAPLAAFVLPHPAARVTGIPYCERHRDAVRVVAPKEMFGWSPLNYLPGFAERLAEKRQAFLKWRSLPMMRRYLEANRQAKSRISKGYRAPNLFQRIVTALFSGARPATPHPSNSTDSSHKASR